jgi:hypothetical protein
MNRRIIALLFALSALSFCLMGEISLQDANKSSLAVVAYPSFYIISQPFGIGPACEEIGSQSDCQSTSECEWTEEASCQFMVQNYPATITVPGDCSGDYGDLITQKIAKYNYLSGSWESISTCDPEDIGGGIYSCQEMDGRTMAWDTNTCKISVDLVVRQSESQAPQFPILNFLFNAIEKGNVVIFTLSIAIAFAIGLYISEVISKPKPHRRWKRYLKKNNRKVRAKSRKKSRKR